MVAFFVSIVAVSLSGVMAPGPITAATLAAGVRSRHAGVLIALGHAAIEMPLILLLATGVGGFLTSPTAQAGIGLAGGMVLMLMGLQLLLSLRRPSDNRVPVQRHPLLTGMVLSVANPYFFVWWATVGLTLTLQALAYGLLFLTLFAIVHWLCDLVWLEVLSLAGFTGSAAFGARAQTVVTVVCGLVMVGFGVKFLYDAGCGVIPVAVVGGW